MDGERGFFAKPRPNQSGIFVKRTGNTVTFRHVVERFATVGAESVQFLGGYIRNDRIAYSDGLEATFGEKEGITIAGGRPSQLFQDFHEVSNLDGPANNFGDAALHHAQSVFGILLLISSKNVETNIWGYQKDQSRTPTTLSPFWIRLSHDVQKALEAKDIRAVTELLGWPEGASDQPVSGTGSGSIEPTAPEEGASILPTDQTGGFDLPPEPTIGTVPDEGNSQTPPPLFLNEVFQRFAKIRVIRTHGRDYPYARTMDGKILPLINKVRIERLLTHTEDSLRLAAPFQFLPNVASSILNDKIYTISGDITLPSPTTWIDNYTEDAPASGALLVDDGKGRILISVLFNLTNSPLRELDTGIPRSKAKEEILLEALGKHTIPLVMVPNIVFDRKENTISLPDEKNILPLFTEADRFPGLYDYRTRLEQDKERDGFFIEEVLLAARKTLLLAHAVGTKDPRIRFNPVPTLNLADESIQLKRGRAARRTASVVALNPDFMSQPAIEIAQTDEGPRVAAVFTSVVAAENGGFHAETPNPEVSPAPPASTLTEDEQIEVELKRIDAFEEARVRLLADAQMYLAQAQNRGLSRFECRVGLNNPGFPIHLHFSAEQSAEGDKKIRGVKFTLDGYAQAYTERGIPLTMNDAVDLKVLVQSTICNTEGIIPIHGPSTSGQHVVELDTQMPLPVLDYNILQRSGGMFSVIFKAVDPYTKRIIRPSIPLGLAARHDDEEAERRELDDRTQYVINYLLEVEKKRTSEGYRAYVTKRDVLMKLQSHLEGQNKEWVTAERMELHGFEANSLIHVSSQSSQKITLAPIMMRMDVGGDNPSWHCNLPFFIGDKNKAPMGELVRTRSLNLHTLNPKLAVARALETLLGVKGKSGEQYVEGFLPTLQRHMRETGHEWRVENEGTPQEEVYIGDQPLQYFLDDMMRYEHDIGIKLDKREIGENGNIKITLQALRSLTGDHGKTAQYVPEHVYESEDGKRKPIAFMLIIPGDKSGKIDEFVQAIHDHVTWHASEAYSSVALGADGQTHQRKRPLEYRTAQIRQSVIRAVEELHEKYFGSRLPKNWHKPKAPTALSSEPPARERAYRQQRPFALPDCSDHFTRYLRRACNPRFALV